MTINGGELDFLASANAIPSSVTLYLGSNNALIGILLNTTTWNVGALVTGPGMLTKKGPGMMVLTGATNNYSGGTLISQGILTAGSSSALGTGGVTLANSATLALGISSTGVVIPNAVSVSASGIGNIQLAETPVYSSGGVGAITLGSEATLAVTIGSTPATGVTHGALQAISITFNNSATGTFDLGRNDLDVTGEALSAVNGLIGSAFYNGKWNGPGITSSTAANDSTHLTALGVIANNDGGVGGAVPLYGTGGLLAVSFDGIAPSSTDVLVKFTYYGDTNLDGKVDGSDYSRIDAAYGTAATGWFNGDFNYDGVIDGSDYTLIDNTFNSQGASLTASVASQLPVNPTQLAGDTAVPEPAALAFLSAAVGSLLGRRKKPL